MSVDKKTNKLINNLFNMANAWTSAAGGQGKLWPPAPAGFSYMILIK